MMFEKCKFTELKEESEGDLETNWAELETLQKELRNNKGNEQNNLRITIVK